MLHKYLRAVGFSKARTRQDLNNIINIAARDAKEKAYTTIDDDILYSEYHCEVASRIGVCVRGEYDDNNKFIFDYYFPYLEGKGISTYEDVSIEKQVEKLSFAGVVDDYKIGISLIFFVNKIITYMKYLGADRLPLRGTSLTLSGLSDQGTILLPISKNEEDIRRTYEINMRKSRMLREAVSGNEQAIESLTISDMDTINNVHVRVRQEDIYSLVDTCFMPYGVECDLYSILGEITSVELVTNKYTGEEVYVLTLNVNDLIFDVCVNKLDVVGEPEAGRRYKGTIWLQGSINFPE